MVFPKSATQVFRAFWKRGLPWLALAFLTLAGPPGRAGDLNPLRDGWEMHAGADRFDGGPWVRVDPFRSTPAPDNQAHDGLAWFRRDLEGAEAPMALALAPRGRAVEVFWDGRVIGRSGRLGPLPVPGPLDRLEVFRVPPGQGRHLLEVKVQVGLENRRVHPFRGFGLGWWALYGPETEVRLQAGVLSTAASGLRLHRALPDLILVVIFLMAGLWHLQYYLLRRDARENLWFGLGSLLMGARQFMAGGWPLGWSWPAFRVFQVESVVIFSACLVMVEFLRCLAAPAMARRLRIYQGLLLAPILALFVLPPAWAEWSTLRVGPFWALPIPVALVLILVDRHRRKDPEARILLGGALLFLLGLLAYIAEAFSAGGHLDPIGWTFALFLCSMAVLGNLRSVRAQARAQDLARELEGQLRERQRLSRDLHDGLGGHLSSAILLSETLARHADAATLTGRLPMLGDVLGQCMEELRSLVWILQDQEGSLAGLALQLQDALSRRLRPHGLALEFSASFGDAQALLSRTTRFHLLRIVQEWTTNTLKHAGAAVIQVELGETAGAFRMRYADDGRGFDLEAATRGHGLGNVRHRCEEMGGTLAFRTRPGQGFDATLGLVLNGHGKF